MVFLIFHLPPLSYESVVSGSDGGGSGAEMAVLSIQESSAFSRVSSTSGQEELEEEPLVPDQPPQLCVLTTEEGWSRLQASSAEGVFLC